MIPSVSLADVARMRLVSQSLVAPHASPVDAVRHMTCIQGQDFPGSTTSIALRTTGRSLAEVRAAYDTGLIVRSWPMRGTLFVMPAEDAGWIGGLTAEKTIRGTARRRGELGLTDEALDRARAVAHESLTGTGLSRADLLARFTEAGVPTEGGASYHVLFHLAVRGDTVLGPTDGTGQRFVLTHEWIPNPRRPERDAAVRELLQRYVVSHGPVTLDDFCWWTKLGKAEARAALADIRDTLGCVDVDGREFFTAPDLPDRYATLRRATAAPMLLPGFDEIVLGYGDRRAVLTAAEEALVVPGANGVFKGTVIHRGHAVATWRRARKAGAPVDVAPFTELAAPVFNAIPRLTGRLPS